MSDKPEEKIYDEEGYRVINLISGYRVRPYLKKIYENRTRFMTLVLPRRAGKTTFCVNYMIEMALRNDDPSGVFIYAFPFRQQAKEVVWPIFKQSLSYLNEFRKGLVKYNENELKITLPNNTVIFVKGTDKPDNIRGGKLKGLIYDEFQDGDPYAWTGVLSPALADSEGWAIFCGTPRGRNHLYQHFKMPDEPDTVGWSSVLLKSSETKHLSEQEFANQRRQMAGTPGLYEQEFECFKPNTLIATMRGSIAIQDLRIGDSVLTHRNRWKPITKILNKKYKGELVGINSFGSQETLFSTPEHPYLLQNITTQERVWTAAKDIKKGDFILLPKFKSVKSILSETLVRLIAWFICEGSASYNSITFSLNPNNQLEIDRVKKLIDDLGYKWKEYSKGQLTICNTELADKLVAWGGNLCYNKKIPFDLISGYEEIFFNELMLGDGHYNSKQVCGWMFSTTSKGLAYDIQLLASSLNRRSNIVVRKSGTMISPANGKEYPAKESYCIRISENRLNYKSRDVVRTKYGIAVKVRSVHKELYSDTVHNISVKDDESYVANGKIVHNCSFDVAGVGSYYADYLTEAKNDGRIGLFPYNKDYSVITAWDLGVNDDTVVIFAQQYGDQVFIIDSYKTNNVTDFGHFLKMLEDKGYNYSRHILPFDSKQRHSGAAKTVFEQLNEVYPNKVKQADRKIKLLPGIETVKVLLPMVSWNETTTEWLRTAIFQYRSVFDEKLGVQDRLPLHDWTSHAADALRYLAVGLKKIRPQPKLNKIGMYNPLKSNQIRVLKAYNPFKYK